VSYDLHGGDVVVARVPIAKTLDVRFVKCVDGLLLESFVNGIVFARCEGFLGVLGRLR
jgi:hypothetical protein